MTKPGQSNQGLLLKRRRAYQAVAKAKAEGHWANQPWLEPCQVCGALNRQYLPCFNRRLTKVTVVEISHKCVAHHGYGYEPENQLRVWWICRSCNALLENHHHGEMDLEQARLYVLDHQPLRLVGDRWHWHCFLAEAKSFRCECAGMRFTAVKETRSGSSKRPRKPQGVWYAHKRIKSVLHRKYLGTSETATAQKLWETALYFSSQRDGPQILPELSGQEL